MISSKTSMENYKTLKFDSNLVPKILSGDKTSTWRLFDDKDLKVGDNLILIEKETGKEFAKAVITEVEDSGKRFFTRLETQWDVRLKKLKDLYETI